tara:strand:+ start:1977 stop:2714 length:738 start_codon:yes stop_codon:yes gene_type:complete
MKNYLIRSLYKIKSPMWFEDRSSEGDLYDWYMKMHEISLRSFEKNLQGNWEFIFFNKEVDNIQEVFKDHFFEIYDIWKQGECNILYCGPDNMMMKPTEFFGKYDDFRMFNYTDPKSSVEPNHYDVQHEHFFNADVRYYPSTMSQDIWDMGLEMAENWDFNSWNTEQFILNKMLWDQEGRTIENTLDPTVAYQGHHLFISDWEQRKAYSNNWNNCNLKDAHIVHLHGSRNAPQKHALMEQLEKLVE